MKNNLVYIDIKYNSFSTTLRKIPEDILYPDKWVEKSVPNSKILRNLNVPFTKLLPYKRYSFF